MNKLFQKSELLFAVVCMVVYLLCLSLANDASSRIGCEKSITVLVSIALAIVLFMWIRSSGHMEYFGLCKPKVSSKRALLYIPLIVIATSNLWLGVAVNVSILESVFYIVSMLMIGFLEEVVFRGFLFKSLCHYNVKMAIAVSTITFGLGHIFNLFNGGGMSLYSNILQVCYALAIGFLFTIVFYKTGSLVPCIIAHGVFNALSVFANQNILDPYCESIVAAIIIVVSIVYSVYLIKRLPNLDAA